MIRRGKKNEGIIRIDIVVLCVLLFIFFVLLAVYIGQKMKSSSPPVRVESESAAGGGTRPTPNIPVFPLPTGKQSYTVSYGDKNVVKPKMVSIAIDPLESPIGSKHTLTFSVTSASPVTQIKTTLFSDNKTMDLPSTLVRGTAAKGDWEAVWTTDDTTDKIYKITFHLESAQGVRDDDIVLR